MKNKIPKSYGKDPKRMLEVFTILEGLQESGMLNEKNAYSLGITWFEWVSTQHYFLSSAKNSYAKVKEHLQNMKAMIESDEKHGE